MRTKWLNKATSIVVASTMVLSTGCTPNKMMSNDVRNYPVSNPVTKQELMDFYSKSLKYVTPVERDVTVHRADYEVKKIEGEKENKLKELTTKALDILANDEYLNMEDEGFEEAQKILSEDTFYYLKSSYDNYCLSDPKIKDIMGAIGYYFVDVELSEKPIAIGNFNQRTSLLGMNGVFKEDYVDHTYYIDETLLTAIVREMNKYNYENKIMQNCTYENGVFKLEDGVAPQVVVDAEGNLYVEKDKPKQNLDEFSDATLADDTTAANEPKEAALSNEDKTEAETTETPDSETETSDDDKESTDTESDTTDETTEDSENADSENAEGLEEYENAGFEELQKDENEVSIVASSRQIQFDVSKVNSVIGQRADSEVVFPNLDDVYVRPEGSGTLWGYGLQASCENGLRNFGITRDSLEGTTTIRFVFKDAADGSGDIIGTNAYTVEEQVATGISSADSNLEIPTILRQGLEQIIERSDRAIVDNDLTALMSGSIYTDMGTAVLRGYANKHTGLSKYISKLNDVIVKDDDNNIYVVSVETYDIEGARDVDLYGAYKDNYYMAIQQDGDQFHIVDVLRTKRNLVSEPDINIDSAVKKSLIALNLAGEVSDTNKEEIKEVLTEWYNAGTYRIEIQKEPDTPVGKTSDNVDVFVKRGLKQIFTDDITLLTTEKRDHDVQLLENILTKYGFNVSSEYSGTVTQWIGGYDNQAEFTTEEMIYFPARGIAERQEVYYLMNKFDDKWSIVERRVLDDESEVTGENLTSLQERLK